MKTYIFGHQKPDLDSVVAAITFAEYCKQNGVENPTPVIVDEINPETSFVLTKFGIATPELITAEKIAPEDKIILVDHNEVDQRLIGINPDQVIAIYDHHKANINFSNPIEICIMPFGSSNTLAWHLFSISNKIIDEKLAQIMLSAILSDTVGLKSSTTTNKDREAVTALSAIAKISDTDTLTLEIFKAKSDISQLSDEQVVMNDYKVFDFGGKRVFIGQTETVEQDNLLNNRLSGLQTAIKTIKDNEKADYAFLAITDILKVNTKLISAGEGENQIAINAFGGKDTNFVLDIGAKMSRKKDIAPQIEKSLTSTTN